MGFHVVFLVSAAVAAIGALLLRSLSRSQIPPHLLGHTVEYTKNLISPEHGLELKKLVLEMKEYPSNINADTKTGGWKVRHPHIGEAVPTIRGTDANGTATAKCAHDFLTPTVDKSQCILPQRIDVGKHFILTGGADGMRENFQSTLQRVTSFGRYYMGTNGLDPRLPPLVSELFAMENFQKAAKNICPADQQLLDPFQFNVIMQIPGQTVASHIDAPYFWGADRLDFPQWLLAVMVFSNLFSKDFIHQVQVVGYLSDISGKAGADGEFIYYQKNDEGRYSKETAEYLAGSCVDGSKLVHASRVYSPAEKVPYLDKDKDSSLVYVGDGKWELRVDNVPIKEYSDDDLRISIVYRARCFKDEEELAKYRSLPAADHMSLDHVLSTLIDGLAAAAVTTKEAAHAMPKVDLAMLLISHYIKYPLPSIEAQPIMPWNYCLISKEFPWLGDLC